MVHRRATAIANAARAMRRHTKRATLTEERRLTERVCKVYEHDLHFQEWGICCGHFICNCPDFQRGYRCLVLLCGACIDGDLGFGRDIDFTQVGTGHCFIDWTTVRGFRKPPIRVLRFVSTYS